MLRFLALPTLAALASPALADVQVAFIEPERYVDASLHGGFGASSQEPALAQIRTHLEKLGERYLTPEQTLTVEVLDLDLAGRFEPWRIRLNDVRVVTDITWPKIVVRYALTENGTTLVEAEETIADMSFLMRASTRRGGSLRYEKAMIDEWFRERIVQRLPPQD